MSPIRVAPSGRYFETFDNQPFLMIGFNDALSWPSLAGLSMRRDRDGVARYLENVAAHGVNILRVMLEYAHHDKFFERPIGSPWRNMVRWWDDFFEECERVGLRVLLTPFDTFWMARRWHKHPYNTHNGGPAHSPGDFFTSEAVYQAQVERLRFVTQRWGRSGALAAWDLWNEIHPHWGGSPSQQNDVLARLSDELRQIEEKTWGFARPQTVSIFGPKPDEEYEALVFRNPGLDFCTTHIYEGAIDFPRDTVTPAVTMSRWVRHALALMPPNRPFTDSEHGPIHAFNDFKKTLPEPFDDEYERHLMWSHLASGGAGSGMRWPARHPHVLTPGMLRALKSLSDFVPLLDWRHFTPRDIASQVRVSTPGVLTFGCGDGHQAVIWLLRGKETGNKRGVLAPHQGEPGVTLQGRDWTPGRYRVRFWDTLRGRELPPQTATAGADGTLCVPLPPLGNDLAMTINEGTSKK